MTEAPTSKTCREIRVSLIHSEEHTRVLHETMNYIHQDRDTLLAALLDYCGFLKQAPKFFHVVAPKRVSRKHLQRFHDSYYLDILEFKTEDHDCDTLNPLPSLSLLDSLGLTDDCAIPAQPAPRAALWNYLSTCSRRFTPCCTALGEQSDCSRPALGRRTPPCPVQSRRRLLLCQ